MTTKNEVELFLKDLKLKIDLFGLLYRDERSKNSQAMYDLEIIPSRRKEYIKSLQLENYADGPLEEKLHGLLPLWIFGKVIKGREIYIKISLGLTNSEAVCISFHTAEKKITYPFKK